LSGISKWICAGADAQFVGASALIVAYPPLNAQISNKIFRRFDDLCLDHDLAQFPFFDVGLLFPGFSLLIRLLLSLKGRLTVRFILLLFGERHHDNDVVRLFFRKSLDVQDGIQRLVPRNAFQRQRDIALDVVAGNDADIAVFGHQTQHALDVRVLKIEGDDPVGISFHTSYLRRLFFPGRRFAGLNQFRGQAGNIEINNDFLFLRHNGIGRVFLQANR